MTDYNTQRKSLSFKEYGRNVQKMLEYIMTVPDMKKRTDYAAALIELMRILNPALRENQDNNHKLWDHLYIMSDFALEADSPFPKPDRSVLDKKPERMQYNTKHARFKHYGRNMELLLEKVVSIEDPAERETALLQAGKLMKSFYMAWNKENIDEEVIAQQMSAMTGGKGGIDVSRIKAEGLFDISSVRRDRSGVSKNKGGKHRQGRRDGSDHFKRDNNNRRPRN